MKRLRKAAYIIGPIGLVVLLGTVLLNSWSSGPSVGTVHILTAQATPTSSMQAQPLAITTDLFMTSLPNGFIRKNTSPPNPPIMAVRAVADSVQSRLQVGIVGGTLPANGLNGLGDYILRVNQTTAYVPSKYTGLPVGSVAFEDTARSMTTIFWPHAASYAEITVSSDPTSTASQYSLLSKILQTWQWK